MANKDWYSVRSVFRRDMTEEGRPRRSFEERVVLFRAESFEEALTKGEDEARRYAADLRGRMLEQLVAYHIHDDALQEGDEVWSCVRDLDITDDAFLGRIYDGELESFCQCTLT